MKNIADKKDNKVDATAIIWGCATGITAICLSATSTFSNVIILPLTVILGASISTVAVWQSDKQKKLKSVAELQQIKRRVQDLETICIQKDI